METINHTERAHALLSASGAKRWMSCTPSMRLEQVMIKQNPEIEHQSSDFAAEGTLAHEFGELELRKSQKLISTKEYNKQLQELRKHRLYKDDMEEYVGEYVSYILGLFADAKRRTAGAELLIEQRVDFSYLVEEGFGSNDAIIIADGVLDVGDLKYGKGERVEAFENPQLMLYALGSLRAFDLAYDIHTVRLHIIQPRLDHISSWEISVEALEEWAETQVLPKAEMAFAGQGELHPGSHCKYCKAAPRCTALAEFSLSAAKIEFDEPVGDPNLLSDEEMVEIYHAAPTISNWLKSVEEHMLGEAKKGKKFAGLKIVEGRSNRKWLDEEKVAELLLKAGKTKDEIYKSKLIGIGDAEKLLTKPTFNTLLSDVVIKPAGMPSLVPETDKRPEMGSLAQAQSDFS